MYYLLCDICCQGMLKERELCEVDGNLFKGYLKIVKQQIIYKKWFQIFKFKYKDFLLGIVCENCLAVHRLVESMFDLFHPVL